LSQIQISFIRPPSGDPHSPGFVEKGWMGFSRVSQNTLDTSVLVTELEDFFIGEENSV